MAYRTAFLLALLVAASQAAPQGLVDSDAQQSNSSTAATDASSSTSGSSGADSSSQQTSSTPSTGFRPPSIVIPPISNFLPTFNFSGAPASTGASAGSSGQNPIAAIISIIPNAINAERERWGSAAQQLISQQMGAATDSIGAAAQTGGQLLTNGIQAIAAWPTFWANLLG